MSRGPIVFAVLCSLSPASFAQEFSVPAEKQEELRETALVLVLADHCNKRFDDPKLFEDATTLLGDFFAEAGADEPYKMAHEAAKQIEEAPMERSSPYAGILVNEESCGNVREALDEHLDR